NANPGRVSKDRRGACGSASSRPGPPAARCADSIQQFEIPFLYRPPQEGFLLQHALQAVGPHLFGREAAGRRVPLAHATLWPDVDEHGPSKPSSQGRLEGASLTRGFVRQTLEPGSRWKLQHETVLGLSPRDGGLEEDPQPGRDAVTFAD